MSYDYEILSDRVTDLLRRNPRLPLKEIAKELGVAQRTIQNVASAHLSGPLRSLRQRFLAEYSHRLLRKGTMSVKEVSFALGFSSQRSFARAIRRATGLSPTELREVLMLANLPGGPSQQFSHHVARKRVRR